MHPLTSSELTILKRVSIRGVHHISRSLQQRTLFHISIICCKIIHNMRGDVMEHDHTKLNNGQQQEHNLLKMTVGPRCYWTRQSDGEEPTQHDQVCPCF